MASRAGANRAFTGAGLTSRDVFVCHASEDKHDVANPLAAALQQRGLTVWIDEQELHIGDSLLRRIDEGLVNSTFGVVVLSPSFFRKAWPKRELDSLTTRELVDGRVVVLPVWHKVDRVVVAGYSPALADKLSATTLDGIDRVADQIAARVRAARDLIDSGAHAGDVLPARALDPDGWESLMLDDTLCISERSGDIRIGTPQGLFHGGVRILSEFRLTLDREPVAFYSPSRLNAFAMNFIGRLARATDNAERVVVRRSRYVGRGLREDFQLFNYEDERVAVSVALHFSADFALLENLRHGRSALTSEAAATISPPKLAFWASTETGLGTLIRAHDSAEMRDGVVTFDALIPAHGTWSTCVSVVPAVAGNELTPVHPCGAPVGDSAPEKRLDSWRRLTPQVASDRSPFAEWMQRGAEDLGALRRPHPGVISRTYLSAGAPWRLNLVSRDALFASYMALLVDPNLALDTVLVLAEHQGVTVDPRTEEEPGRIPHELRLDSPSSPFRTYGAADATPLFAVLLGELRRWGLAREVVDKLLPNLDAALNWIDNFGDRDGDGYVEYERLSTSGPLHQGWRGSDGAMRFRDGEPAQPPIALAEVQAYVYGAYLAGAYFADEVGDNARADLFRRKANNLKARFNEDFWIDDDHGFASGLDHNKRHIDGTTSTIGHCLWMGIVDADKAAHVVNRLMSPEMFSGWGIRTLSDATRTFDPTSYHNGSVWPHDNALLALGAMKYNFSEAAERIVVAQLEAAQRLSYRVPEFFGGFAQAEFGDPVVLPTACRPAALSAAAPFLLLRTVLRLDPWIPHGRLYVRAVVPELIGDIHLARVPIAGGRVGIDVQKGVVTMTGLPEEIQVIDAGGVAP
jgi:glycogen debranching enzyme